MLRAYGEASSQAAAEAQAVAALNAQRDFRYGKAAASPAFTINHSSDTCRS